MSPQNKLNKSEMLTLDSAEFNGIRTYEEVNQRPKVTESQAPHASMGRDRIVRRRRTWRERGAIVPDIIGVSIVNGRGLWGVPGRVEHYSPHSPALMMNASTGKYAGARTVMKKRLTRSSRHHTMKMAERRRDDLGSIQSSHRSLSELAEIRLAFLLQCAHPLS